MDPVSTSDKTECNRDINVQGSSEHIPVVFMTAVFVTAVCLTALNTMGVFEAAVSALYETECTQLQCSR